jgi:hypothetical protein
MVVSSSIYLQMSTLDSLLNGCSSSSFIFIVVIVFYRHDLVADALEAKLPQHLLEFG